MRKRKNDSAVSEVLGIVLLLGMAVGLFSVLSLVVLSYPFSPETPAVNLIGMVDDKNVSIVHNGGQDLSLNTEVLIRINDSIINLTASENLTPPMVLDDGYWNVGEEFRYYNETITDARVEITVVDKFSNSIVLMGLLQEGI